MKRAFTIFGIVFLILIIGVLIYLYFFLPREGQKNTFLEDLFPTSEEDPQNTQQEQGEGEGPDSIGNNEETSSEEDLTENPFEASLVLLVSSPVSGFEPFIDSQNSSSTAVRYMKKNNGNIFKTSLLGINTVRISSSKIQNIYDSYWSQNGNYLIARFLGEDNETIKGYLIDLSSYQKGEEYTFDGKFLIDDIQDFSKISPSNEVLFVVNIDEKSFVSLLNLSTGKTTPLFSSPFSEWLVQWSQTGEIFLITKASGSAPGYIYKLNQSKDQLTRVLGGINGLTALVSPDGAHILYSKSVQGGVELSLYNTQTRESIQLTQNTLPEKCVWENTTIFFCAIPQPSPLGEYPDDWYKGKISFTDSLMKFQVGNPVPVKVYPLSVPIDAVSLDVEGDYLYFIDRNTSFLWARKIHIDKKDVESE